MYEYFTVRKLKFKKYTECIICCENNVRMYTKCIYITNKIYIYIYLLYLN